MKQVSLILVTNGKGEILLGKRSDRGTWTMPGGGLNEGEDKTVAAARELYEETGLRPKSLTHIKSEVNPSGAMIHLFSALCSGDAHSTHDPDEEVKDGAWKWIPVLKGIPRDVWENLEGPPGEANLLRQLFSVEEGEGLAKATNDGHREKVWWHGSPSGELVGGKVGLHIGTRKAAEQALHARIGVPAEGSWDGTREYGKTLLAGHKTLQARGVQRTGYNSGPMAEDHYATAMPTFGDGTSISPNHKPDIFPVRIVGPMSNTPMSAHDDFRANGYMAGAIKRGAAKRGYYYRNVAEDEGSVSAVVPNGGAHLERLPRDSPYAIAHSGAGLNKALPSYDPFQDLSPQGEQAVARWQVASDPDYQRRFREDPTRENIPRMEGPARVRGLHKLSGKTQVKVHPDGTRSFLMHRAMSPAEAQSAVGPAHVSHDRKTSWTPIVGAPPGELYSILHNFKREYKGPITSAWIHQNDIHAMLPMWGAVHPRAEDNAQWAKENDFSHSTKPAGPGYQSPHWETIVGPHKSQLATPEEHEKAFAEDEATLDGRINDRVKTPAFSWKGKKDLKDYVKKHEPSEAAHLLEHPDPIERSLALKMDSTDPTDVANAILDPDHNVYKTAFYHPLSNLALRVLAHSTRDHEGNPVFHRHEDLMADPRLTDEHLHHMIEATQDDPSLPIQVAAAHIEKVRGHSKYPKLRMAKAVIDNANDFAEEVKAPHLSNPAAEEPMPHHHYSVEAYRQGMAAHVKPERSSGIYDHADKTIDKLSRGGDPKMIYKLPVKGYAKAQKFIVKPYSKHGFMPGWAENTNQAMYHAAGIGRLHQETFTAPHGYGDWMVPAQVIRAEPAKDIGNTSFKRDHLPTNQADIRKIQLMDFLIDNQDRHSENLLVRPDKTLLAIDHGSAFSYAAGHNRPGSFPQDRDYQIPGLNSWDARHVLPWYDENKLPIQEAFEKRLENVTDPRAKYNLRAGFQKRINWLNKRVEEHRRGRDPKWKAALEPLLGDDGMMSKALAGGKDQLMGVFGHQGFDATLGAKMIHNSLMKAHPAAHQNDVNTFEKNLNDSNNTHEPTMVWEGRGPDGKGDIEPKAVYQHGGKRYMVKPASNQQTPLSAWNELTNQAMYHAGGIGHLHQKVHATQLNIPGGKGNIQERLHNPALVVHMEPGVKSLHQAFSDVGSGYEPGRVADRPEAREAMRRIAIMDYLTGNSDRHSNNLMIQPNGLPLAIDHGGLFDGGHRPVMDHSRLLTHNAALVMGGLPGENPEAWKGTWDWFDKNKGAMLDKFREHANMIPEHYNEGAQEVIPGFETNRFNKKQVMADAEKRFQDIDQYRKPKDKKWYDPLGEQGEQPEYESLGALE